MTTSFDSTIGTMTGLIPVALAGGITIGLTKAALQVPEEVDRHRRVSRRTYRRTSRRTSGKSTLSTIFGPSSIL